MRNADGDPKPGWRRDIPHLPLAILACFLAGGGVLVSVLGERLGQPLLEDRIGPTLTLIGAGAWLVGRFRSRGGRDRGDRGRGDKNQRADTGGTSSD